MICNVFTVFNETEHRYEKKKKNNGKLYQKPLLVDEISTGPNLKLFEDNVEESSFARRLF